MRVSLKIPNPATMKVGKEEYHLLKAGTELHRVHLDQYGSDEFNGTDKGDARFSPIRDAGGTIIPTIYAAESFECAACEIILRCPDSPHRNRTKVAPPRSSILPTIGFTSTVTCARSMTSIWSASRRPVNARSA